MVIIRTITRIGVLALLLSLVACGEEAIVVYEAPKNSQPIAKEAPAPSSPAAAAIGMPWQAPAGWRLLPENPPMRLATYVAKSPSGEVEVAISRFPGDVGGMLANVNRWRGQIGLSPIEEEELPSLLVAFDNGGFQGHFMHLRGPEVDMLAASILESAANQTWFVRVIAPPEDAEAVKEEVFDFARTFGAAVVEP